MTTDLATTNPPDLTPSSLGPGLRLLAARPPIRMVSDPMRGRYLERLEYPDLDPVQRQTLERTRDLLIDRLTPGTDAGIIAHLARIANHHSKDRTPGQWQMLFEDYCCDLREFSTGHVEQACLEHRRSSNWFPKIAELRTRCIDLVALDKSRLERCDRTLGIGSPAHSAPAEVDPERAGTPKTVAEILASHNRKNPFGDEPAPAGDAARRSRASPGPATAVPPARSYTTRSRKRPRH